jgi:hypothetical protein
MALLRYATALGIDHREARKLSGMPVEPPVARAFGRWIAAGAAAVLVAVASLVLVLAFGRGGTSAAERQAASLTPPWNVTVDVLNGGGDINYTRRVASRVGPSSATGSSTSTKANRFDYKATAVYFEPGGAALAQRLATQIGCGKTSPLPGGNNPRRLVVIVGPARATC